MAVLEQDGIAKLTMRRLAVDLDTGPASLYVYVRSTTEIHALVIDRLLGELELTWSGRGSWQTRLRRLLVGYIDILVQHPGLARSALVTWPDGRNYLDVLELALRLLSAAGVPDSRAAWGVDALLQQATAMAAEYGSRGEPDRPQSIEQLSALIDGADPARHPTLTRLGGAQLVGGQRDERRDWALDALVAGIVATPCRPGESRADTHHPGVNGQPAVDPRDLSSSASRQEVLPVHGQSDGVVTSSPPTSRGDS